MNRFVKIGLISTPIIGALAGLGIFLATEMSSSNTNEINTNGNGSAGSGEVSKGVKQNPPRQPHSHQNYKPEPEPKPVVKQTNFETNGEIPSAKMQEYEHISVFPDIGTNELYQYIRIDNRRISLDKKVIAYVVNTAIKKAPISDGSISFGYKYTNQDKTMLSISLFWIDDEGDVRKIRTYNIKLDKLSG